MSHVPRILWAIVALMVAALVWSWYTAGTARSMALVEGARADEFARQRTVAERDAADARRQATAYGDSVVLARQASDAVVAQARAVAASARVRAETAEGRVRATLDSLGASTAALDSLVEAHHEEIAAVQEQVAVVTWERDVLTRYADSAEGALRTADAVNDALRWEVQSLRRQVDLMDRARAPSWQTKAGAGVAARGVLALVVVTR